MQIWAESRKSALPICNYSQILYQFLTFTQNLKRSLISLLRKFYEYALPFSTAVDKAFFSNNHNLSSFH